MFLSQALDTADGHRLSTRPGPSSADVVPAQSRPPKDDADLAALLAQASGRTKVLVGKLLSLDLNIKLMHNKVTSIKRVESVTGPAWVRLSITCCEARALSLFRNPELLRLNLEDVRRLPS